MMVSCMWCDSLRSHNLPCAISYFLINSLTTRHHSLPSLSLAYHSPICFLHISLLPPYLTSLPPSVPPFLPPFLPPILSLLSSPAPQTFYTPHSPSPSPFPFPSHIPTGKLVTEEVEYLVEGKQSSDPGNMGPLFEWLPQQIWPRIKALEGLKRFSG